MRLARSLRVAIASVLRAGAGVVMSPAQATPSELAFASNRDGDFDVYVMNADGSNVVQLTNEPGVDFEPAWSPDGQRIAFSSNRDGDFEIFVMNGDGTGVVQVTATDSSAADRTPAWSPDGRFLAFQRPLDPVSGVHVDLYQVELATGTITRLTDGGGFSSGRGAPDWSPEPRIVFHRRTDGSDWELAVRDSDGTVTQLTNNGYDDTFPDWFPGGATAAFTSAIFDAGDIWAIDLATGAQTPLTSGPDRDVAPSVDCDGSRISFVRVPAGGVNGQIWVMGADGTAQANISNNAASDTQPDWRCVPPEADLSITKSDAGFDPVNIGDSVTYTVTVTNNGPDDATGVVVTDTLPGRESAGRTGGCLAEGSMSAPT